MRCLAWWLLTCVVLTAGTTCAPEAGPIVELPVETRYAFTNFSTRFYAALSMRDHAAGVAGANYVSTPLLPPGATYRGDFVETLGTACPDGLDLRVFLYRRVNEDIPIGLDASEQVEPTPVAAGGVLRVPACVIEPVEVYTMVNWETPEGVARVKIAQDSPVDAEIRAMGLFPNEQSVWEVTGVDPNLSATPPPALIPASSISGRVTLRDGSGVENVGVLLRTRFRLRLDDGNPDNDPDADWSAPIAVTKTDAAGAFAIDRPPGVYRVEVFSDDFIFRPAVVDVETPLEEIFIIAEPF